jgi:type I restriction enzyme S subunit
VTDALKDVSILIADCPHSTAPWQAEGYPMVRTPNIGRGFFILEDVKRVSEDTYQQWTTRATPQGDDLILAREAPVGNVAIVKPGLQPCLGQRTVLIRPDPTAVLPRYLMYLLLGDEVQERMWSLANGATVPHLNMSDIRALELPTLPPRETQWKIAAILSAYDDFMENNTRRIEILEEMAQAIYREWFVDFRFPSYETTKLIDSELGPIPQGWEVVTLFDQAEVTYGFPFKSSLFHIGPDGRRLIRIRDIPVNRTETFTSEIADEKYIVQNGDVLIGMDGDFHMCRWAGGTSYLNQRVARIRPLAGIPIYFLFLALRQPIRNLNAAITGTTVAHLLDSHLRSILMLQPSDAIVEASHSVLDPIADLELNLRQQNQRLRESRDLLLPKLVSGELDVSGLDIDTGDSAA